MVHSGSSISVEREPGTTEPLVLRANSPGEDPVCFHVETFESVRKKVEERGWYAVPRLIILSRIDDPKLTNVVADALTVERECRRRPRDRPFVLQQETNVIEHRVEYYGDLDAHPSDGWIDIAVFLDRGEVLMLTVETPSSIAYAMAEEQDEAFYCPDLLVVRRIERSLIERAVAALVSDDLSRYGIFANVHDS